jgi:hypothetical protein
MTSNTETTASTVTNSAEKVDKETADRLNNYAQSLNDTITHVVDYGNLTDKTRKNKNA